MNFFREGTSIANLGRQYLNRLIPAHKLGLYPADLAPGAYDVSAPNYQRPPRLDSDFGLFPFHFCSRSVGPPRGTCYSDPARAPNCPQLAGEHATVRRKPSLISGLIFLKNSLALA